MFLTQNGSVVLTHGAFLQKEWAACLTTLRANGRTPSWLRKASAGCWCKQHTIWSWEPSNSNNAPVTHTRNASSHDCSTLLLPKIFLEGRRVSSEASKTCLCSKTVEKQAVERGVGIHSITTKWHLQRRRPEEWLKPGSMTTTSIIWCQNTQDVILFTDSSLSYH